MYGAIALMAAQFPPLENAREDGLLCAGGDLRPERLLAAYCCGIFPWYSAGLPILWWSPDPRCIMPLSEFHLPKRSLRTLRHHTFTLTHNGNFGGVIRACAAPRKNSADTWLLKEMIAAYERLHKLGYAHSIETWDQDNRLVGGLYGVALGQAFFGESMFHVMPEASRAALSGLVSLLRLRGAILLDCQQATPHIMRMGGKLVPRSTFLKILHSALHPHQPCKNGLAPERDNTTSDQWTALEAWGCRYSWSPAGWSKS